MRCVDPAEEGNQPESTVKLVGKVHLDLEFMLDAKTTDQGKLVRALCFVLHVVWAVKMLIVVQYCAFG